MSTAIISEDFLSNRKIGACYIVASVINAKIFMTYAKGGHLAVA